MTQTFECIYDGEVFRPLEKINLKKGERLTVHIECHHSFDPIKLNMPIKMIPFSHCGESRGHLCRYICNYSFPY